MNNDRFKFRVWDNSDKEYIYFDFFSIKTEITYHKIGIIKKNIIEQCVGLKDKNGKLGYENDIVIDEDGNKFVITWLEPFACFGLFTLGGIYHYDETECWLNKYEIIGNIHDKE